MKIGEAEQKLEHAIPLVRVRVIGPSLQAVHHGEGIGEKPIHALGINRSALVPALQGLVRSNKSLIEKMVEAQLLRSKTWRDRIGARCPSAISGNRGVHGIPSHGAEVPPLKVLER